MKRATLTISDEIEIALDAYIRQQKVPPSLTAVVQDALKEYLVRRGFITGERRLRITPAREGSVTRNASVEHDRYLAGK